MKKIYSRFRLPFLVVFLILTSAATVLAQCSVVLTGGANTPTCAYQSVSGGAGEYWTLPVTSGVNYSFFWVGSGCSDNTAFCVNGITNTNNSGTPYTVSAAATGSWDIGFFRANSTWCATSAVLSYKITAPTAGVGATTTATVCASNNTYTIPAGYTSTIGSISWASSGDGTFTSGSTTTTPTYTFGTVDKAVGGIKTLTMTVNNGGCTATATFALTIVPTPTAGTGTPSSATVCTGAPNQYSPAGYTATNGTIGWSTSGDGTFTGGTTTTPTYHFGVNDIANGGLKTLTMTVASAPCASASASFALTINRPPTATQGATHTATVCASTNTYTIPVGYASTNGTISWSTSGDGTFTGGTTLTPTYNFGTNDKANGGAVTLTMTVSNAPCTAASTTFTLSIDRTPPTATVGGTQNICASLVSANLGGNSVSSPFTGTWTQTSGPGSTTFSNPNSGSANATATVAGTYVYTWTITNGTCAPSSANVTVNYYNTPTTAAVTPASQDVCGSLTSPSLGGNIPPAGFGTGTWTLTSGPGTVTFSNANLGTSTATVSAIGTYIFTWTIANGTCPSTSASTTVNYYAAPTTATVGPDQSVCALISSPLGGNVPAVGLGAWSQTSGPGVTFFSNVNAGSSTASVSVQGTYVFTWTITNGPCTSSTSVTVNFYSNPTVATVGSPQNVCGSLTSAGLGGNVATIGTGTWSQIAGPGATTFSNINSPNATATASVTGSYTYEWTISNGTCTPSTADVNVNFIAAPTGGTIPNTAYCAAVGSGNVTVTGVSNANQYSWALPAGLSGSSTTSTISVGGTVGGTYTVTVTPLDVIFGVTCSGTPITGQVTILSQPVIDSVHAGVVSCFGGSNDTLIVYAHTTNGTLFYSINGGTTYPNSTGIFPGLSAGSYNVIVQDDSVCATSYAANPVGVTSPTAISLSIASFGNVNCNGDSSGFITLSISGGTPPYSYSWNNGATSQNLTRLEAGTFTVVATDANGCTQTISQTLTEPTPLTDSIVSTNVSCYGANDGSATVFLFGGSLPYSYQWSNGGLSNTITNLNGAIYSVTGTDNNGCKVFASANILNPLPVTLSLVTTNVSCFGSANGQITANVSGGSGSYTYVWSPPVSAGPTATNLGPGTYTVSVSDINNCSVVDSATITQPLTGLSVSSIVTPVACTGDANGSIQLLASGGVGGYTYSWSSGQSLQIISGLPAGPYTATVTDGNGCQVIVYDTLVDPTPIVSSVVGTSATCAGAGGGSATLTVSGGVPAYTFQWSNFEVTQNLSNLSGGLYRVVITDANGCQHRDSVIITQPLPLTATITTTNIACNGANNGTVTINVSGGTGAYSYAWTPNVSITNTVSNASPGTYVVTVTDANGCTLVDSAVVTQPAAGVSVTAIVTDMTCHDANNGSISAQVSGGTGSYTYAWTGSPAITPTISNLSAGTYTVTVTDANGCTGTDGGTITNPSAITSTTTGTDVTCAGAANGTATVATVSGGTGAYTYLWTTFASTQSISGLSGGLYRVIIKDANGCEHRDSVFVAEPLPLTATVTSTNVACNGANNGTVTINVSGGTGAYSYAWTPNVSITNTVSNASPGTYVVTVTDANGCTLVDSAVVTQPAAGVSVTAIVTDMTCHDANNGSISAQVSGGTGSYTYAWTGSPAITPTISNLSAGTYTVTVTDANGCIGTDGGTITNPSAITSTSTGTDVTCAGAANGTATVATVSGGTGAYTYLWSNFAATQSISGLSGGLYRVIIKDANGCEHRDSVFVAEPLPLVVTLSTSNVNCAGGNSGSITANVTGGTGAYSYAWTPNVSVTNTVTNATAGIYTVTVTDGNGCITTATTTVTQPQALTAVVTTTNVTCYGDSNGTINITVSGGTGAYTYTWSPNVSTGPSLLNAAQGTYSVTVADAGGCSLVESIVITQPASPIIVTSVIHDVSCYGGNDGSILVVASGGTGAYTYQWATGQIVQYVTGLSMSTPRATTTLFIVTVTDANGCAIIVGDTLRSPGPITTSVVGTDVTCAGARNGSATLTVSGGRTPYTYLWSNVATTQNLTNIPGGAYTVVITDSSGCRHTDTVTIHEPLPISITLTTTNISCFGANSGSITAAVTGGTGPYTYTWRPNVSTTNTVTNAAPGTYTLVITDAHGCVDSASTTITQPAAAVSLVVSVTDMTCHDANNGSITTQVSGGSGSYTYAWTGSPALTPDLHNLSAGAYSVTVTDANGCTATGGGTITNPAAITSTTTGTNVTCAGAANGTATVSTVAGGTGPYTYLWSNFAATQSVSGLSGGLQRVIITDAHGCQHRDSVLITEPQPLTATVSSTNVGCSGGNTGSITISVSGGTGAYTYTWSPNVSSGPSATNIGTGTYHITVTDANGCSLVDSATIIQPASTLSVAAIVTDMTCHDANNGSINTLVSGGTGSYTYSWTGSALHTPSLSGLSAGLYSVTVTDAGGCTASASGTITNPSAITSTTAGTNLTCAGTANGTASVSSVSGGTAPYTYLWSTFEATQTITGISGGIYRVIITDAHGCERRDSVIVTEPQPVTATLNVTQISCNNLNDGSITVVASGGTGTLTYLWTPGGQTTATISNLTAGTYSVVTKDVNNCSVTSSATIVNPAPLSVANVVINPRCNGANNGTITLIVNGGTPSYIYTWSGSLAGSGQSAINVAPGSYNMTVTDSHGCIATDSATVTSPAPIFVSGIITNVSCNGSSDGSVITTVYGGLAPYSYQWHYDSLTGPLGPITKDWTQLSGGDYYLEIADLNNCQASYHAVIKEADSLKLTLSKTDLTCFGSNNGTLLASARGGVTPYHYLWNNFVTDSTQTGVAAGNYGVVVTDSNGCQQTKTINVNQPQPITVTATATNPACNGSNTGSVALSVTGGSGTYTYIWSTTPVQNTNTATGLSAGTYYVTVTDANGCNQVDSATLTAPQALVVNTAVSNPTCSDGNNGFVSLDVHQGTAPYTYVWNTTPAQSGNVASGLVAGTYIATITDAGGCQLFDTAIVVAPAPIVISMGTLGNSTCISSADGYAVANVTGGLAPYTYQLGSVAQNSDTFTNLQPGTYTLTVKDANGCQAVTSWTIVTSSSFSVDLSVDRTVILAGETIQLTATPTSDTTVTGYVWSTLDSLNFSGCGDPNNCPTPTATPSAPHTYVVQAVNARGCIATDTVHVSVSNQPSAFMPTAFTPNGDGINDRFEFDILGAKTVDVQIWNRWGEKVFSDPAQSNGITGAHGWDGKFRDKDVEYDVYTYQLVITYSDGHQQTLAGTVTLMR